MEYRKLGNTGLTVSRIGFGVLTMGKSQLNLELNKGADLLKYALDQGINFIDTAQYYETYDYIDKAIEGRKTQPIICSKCLEWTYSDMDNAINEALSKLHRDYIDIFLMHEVRPDELRTGAWDALMDAKKDGRVKAAGISTHHVDVLAEYIEKPGMDVVFPLINFASMGIRKGDGPGTKEEMSEVMKRAHNKGIGVFAMKVFGGGPLVEHYIEAMDYVFSKSYVDSVMMGFGKEFEVDRAISYENGTLPPDYIPDTSKKKTYIEPGNCEGCGTCVARCPNHAMYLGDDGLAHVNEDLCLTCGYCAPVCPVRAIILL